jgi:hypothetical protein
MGMLANSVKINLYRIMQESFKILSMPMRILLKLNLKKER